MTEFAVYLIALWVIGVTYCVFNLYIRPKDLDAEDVDLLKDLVGRLRKLASTERREKG